MKKTITILMLITLLAFAGCSSQPSDAPAVDTSAEEAPAAVSSEIQPSPAETPAASIESLAFTADYVRHGSGLEEDEYPSEQVIRSVDELSDVDASPDFDSTFFESHSLLVVRLMESSGSVRHNVTSVTNDGTKLTVSIDRALPGIGTMDMAAWHILIALPAEVPDQVDVVITDIVPAD